MRRTFFPALCLSLVPLLGASGATGYVGPQVCGQCHRSIAATQRKTNMARTWLGLETTLLPPTYNETHSEGPPPDISYHATRTHFETTLPGHDPVSGSIEDIVGGERHGISFLMRVKSIEGAQLARAPLIETRYLHSTHENALALSPGFPAAKPAGYETALGRVLSPSFEKKCLDCHGQPGAAGSAVGVHCESCHGPGRAHLEAVAAHKPHQGIAKGTEACARCHSGFGVLWDPIPDDLLISNQVNALKNSECYIQTAGRIGCTNCHNPHEDSPRVEARSVATCLSCHSARVAGHAGLCPINRDGECLGCHMPGVTKGSFTMVDHWIRVHPEQGKAAEKPQPSGTQVRPLLVYLRIIVTADSAKAQQASDRLAHGELFFDVARELSVDPSATGGGYLGPMRIADMDPKLAAVAAKLAPGETSAIVDNGSRQIILQRLPRDFRWQANQLQEQGSQLRSKGDLAGAAEKYTEALRIDPRFLRALIFLGVTYGQQGNAERAAGILQFASRLYPEDPAAEYNLGVAYGALGNTTDEIAAFRRAIDLEPDLLPAYQDLGAALYSSGQTEQAADVYRRGLNVNPLAAALYYNLGVLTNSDADIAIARKIDAAFKH